MFCGHLAVEKMLKALCAVRLVPANQIWGHNLILLAQIAGFPLTNQQALELGTIMSFNLMARYDDHKRQFAKTCTSDYVKKWSVVIETWYTDLNQIITSERILLPNNTPAL